MAQLMPLPLTVSRFTKIQIGLPLWYRLTCSSPGKRAVKCMCVCVCVCVLRDEHYNDCRDRLNRLLYTRR